MTRTARAVEFAVLYVGAPLAIALFLPVRLIFPALACLTLVGLALLWRTGGFDWHSLVRGWRRIRIAHLVAIAAVTLLAGVMVLALTRPDAIFGFLRRDPRLLLLVWALYPILSALPQELIFRPLFFHRYGMLFPDLRAAVLVNAAVFSLAHLMYWSVVVTVMTFAGGLLFARAYLRDGFPAAWAMHAVAGNVLFAVGMGVYFYSGNAVRPF